MSEHHSRKNAAQETHKHESHVGSHTEARAEKDPEKNEENKKISANDGEQFKIIPHPRKHVAPPPLSVDGSAAKSPSNIGASKRAAKPRPPLHAKKEETKPQASKNADSHHSPSHKDAEPTFDLTVTPHHHHPTDATAKPPSRRSSGVGSTTEEKKQKSPPPPPKPKAVVDHSQNPSDEANEKESKKAISQPLAEHTKHKTPSGSSRNSARHSIESDNGKKSVHTTKAAAEHAEPEIQHKVEKVEHKAAAAEAKQAEAHPAEAPKAKLLPTQPVPAEVVAEKKPQPTAVEIHAPAAKPAAVEVPSEKKAPTPKQSPAQPAPDKTEAVPAKPLTKIQMLAQKMQVPMGMPMVAPMQPQKGDGPAPAAQGTAVRCAPRPGRRLPASVAKLVSHS